MADKLLDHFFKQKNISALEAHALYKCRSLSRRICDLKERGHTFVTEMKLDHTGQRYARYHYKGWAI